MVLIHIKKTDNNQFMYETTRQTSIQQITAQITQGNSYSVSNLRLKVDRAAQFIQDLIKKGTMKPEQTRGLAQGENTSDPPIPGHIYQPDQYHYRNGWCVPQDLGFRILQTVQHARNLIHKSNADKRICISIPQLIEACELMKGAVNMAYPAYHGLPPWEPAMIILENDDVRQMIQGQQWYDCDSSSIWFAGKEWMRGKNVGFYVKGSENTKIIAKIQRTGAGAPVREPLVDSETQRQMIAWHHKKQEESKQMMGVDDDDYMNSAWADPKSLKKHLHGAGDVKWRFQQ